MKREYIIDATEKKLGRLASQVAFTLRGKTSPDFLPHQTLFPRVVVKNVNGIDINERRLSKESFSRYSGYPSGRKITPALKVAHEDKRKLLRQTIWGMLPKNKLRARMIKSLILYYGETE